MLFIFIKQTKMADNVGVSFDLQQQQQTAAPQFTTEIGLVPMQSQILQQQQENQVLAPLTIPWAPSEMAFLQSPYQQRDLQTKESRKKPSQRRSLLDTNPLFSKFHG